MGTLFSGQDALVLLWLIALEGLLSADNALVLAAMVSTLPKPQQKKALLYGIVGAYAFRIIAVLGAAVLMASWWLKLLGGAYLLHLGYRGLVPAKHKSGTLEKLAAKIFPKNTGRFWAVVIQVEFMDMAFSIDSILAAVAMTNKIWLVIAGGLIGILLLRVAAGFFIAFIEKHPIFKKTAYVLVIAIGAKLAASPWWHPQEVAFFVLLAVIFFGSFVVERVSTQGKNKRP